MNCEDLYKKYKHDVVPIYNFPIHTKRSAGESSLEDYIEVLSILNEPAQVFINGKLAGEVGSGLESCKISSELGKVRVELKRKGEVVKTVLSPLAITDRPLRTDRLTYMYSSRFQEYFEKIYGTEQIAPKLQE